MFSYKEIMVQIIYRKGNNFKEKQVKKALFLISILGIFGFLVSCSSAAEKPALPLVEGKLAFAFFYTDG
jgi:hypothetical protein